MRRLTTLVAAAAVALVAAGCTAGTDTPDPAPSVDVIREREDAVRIGRQSLWDEALASCTAAIEARTDLSVPDAADFCENDILGQVTP